jgi:pimeloyl-ACP methyl ester carboxylesterase
VVLVHGFPELAHSWRHQVGALTAAGYRVAALDCRGYGGSEHPEPASAYAMEAMCADVAAVIGALSPGVPAVVVGHDWGAPIAWNTALIYKDKVRAVAGLSVPHLPMGEASFLQVARAMFTANNRFFYIVYFQDEGVAEAELEADIPATLRRLYWAWSGEAPHGAFHNNKPASARLFDGLPDPGFLPSFLTPEDFATYEAAFRQTGFRGALNRYRNFDRDHAFLRALPSQVITQPAMFIAGRKDPALTMFPFDAVAAMQAGFTDLRVVTLIDGVGHWVQQEAPDMVNTALLGWLAGL